MNIERLTPIFFSLVCAGLSSACSNDTAIDDEAGETTAASSTAGETDSGSTSDTTTTSTDTSATDDANFIPQDTGSTTDTPVGNLGDMCMTDADCAEDLGSGA